MPKKERWATLGLPAWGIDVPARSPVQIPPGRTAPLPRGGVGPARPGPFCSLQCAFSAQVLIGTSVHSGWRRRRVSISVFVRLGVWKDEAACRGQGRASWPSHLPTPGKQAPSKIEKQTPRTSQVSYSKRPLKLRLALQQRKYGLEKLLESLLCFEKCAHTNVEHVLDGFLRCLAKALHMMPGKRRKVQHIAWPHFAQHGRGVLRERKSSGIDILGAHRAEIILQQGLCDEDQHELQAGAPADLSDPRGGLFHAAPLDLVSTGPSCDVDAAPPPDWRGTAKT